MSPKREMGHPDFIRGNELSATGNQQMNRAEESRSGGESGAA